MLQAPALCIVCFGAYVDAVCDALTGTLLCVGCRSLLLVAFPYAACRPCLQSHQKLCLVETLVLSHLETQGSDLTLIPTGQFCCLICCGVGSSLDLAPALL